MTAKAKLVKTKRYLIEEANIPHGTIVNQTTVWNLLRDITIIGIQMIAFAAPEVAQLAEVGGVCAITEVSKAGAAEVDGSLGNVRARGIWSAAGDSGNIWNGVVYMFPEGYGMDIDDGETINIFTAGRSYQAALDTMDASHEICIYYVDR